MFSLLFRIDNFDSLIISFSPLWWRLLMSCNLILLMQSNWDFLLFKSFSSSIFSSLLLHKNEAQATSASLREALSRFSSSSILPSSFLSHIPTSTIPSPFVHRGVVGAWGTSREVNKTQGLITHNAIQYLCIYYILRFTRSAQLNKNATTTNLKIFVFFKNNK